MSARRPPEWPTRDVAILHLRGLAAGWPAAEPRVAWEGASRRWDPSLLRETEDHRLHILARGGDIVCFFDAEGRPLGWRDDGRLGHELPLQADPAAARDRAVAELALAPSTRLLRARAVELGTLGWTFELALALDRHPLDTAALTVWLQPDALKVIQVLGREPLGPAVDDLARAAEREVETVLARRLVVAGMRTAAPLCWAQAMALRTERWSGGSQVRVATWRHWSRATVRVDARTGAVCAWSVPRLALPRLPDDADGATLAALAAALAPAPAGAEFARRQWIDLGGGARVGRVVWRHRAGTALVEGDYHAVDVQPETRALVGVEWRWHEPAPPAATPAIAAEEAVRRVEAARTEIGLVPDLTTAGADLRVVLHQPDREAPGAPADRLAWAVAVRGPIGLGTVFVDAADGAVLYADLP